MNKSFKIICGLLLVIALGFIVFICLTGLGMAFAFIISALPTWQTAVGTFFGSVIVVLHFISEESK